MYTALDVLGQVTQKLGLLEVDVFQSQKSRPTEPFSQLQTNGLLDSRPSAQSSLAFSVFPSPFSFAPAIIGRSPHAQSARHAAAPTNHRALLACNLADRAFWRRLTEMGGLRRRSSESLGGLVETGSAAQWYTGGSRDGVLIPSHYIPLQLFIGSQLCVDLILETAWHSTCLGATIHDKTENKTLDWAHILCWPREVNLDDMMIKVL
ncbi:hypothetical protein C8J56DRAFT_896913 [Mycena floridula]|nr:hypothetical protein C8J56DRAFT_896913 [Mycena floridula]